MMRFLRAAALAFLCAAAAQTSFAADKVLKVGMGFVPETPNPYRGISLPPSFPHHAVYDTLTMLDAKGNVSPSLAVSWKAETPSQWLFTLRKGVAFSNGEPLTAETLIVSATYMATPKGRSETIGSTMYQVQKVEAVDALTARVFLSEPDPLFPLHATAWRVTAPKQWQEAHAEEAGKQPMGIGTGPFVIASWTPGKIVMKANKASWRPPKVDALEIIEIPDETARLQAFASGAVNIVLGVSPDDRTTVERAGGTFFPRLTTMIHFLAANTLNRDTPLADKRVRAALNMAINRQAILTQVLRDPVRPASQLTVPGAFGYDPDLKPLPYDPKKAKALLAEAGYPKGFKMVVGITPGLRPSDTLYYQQIAADLRAVGVEAELQPTTQAKQQKDMFAGKLEVDMFTMLTRGNDMMADYRIRTCLNLTQGRAGYHCDPDVTAVAKDAMAEMDPVKRAALYARIEKLERDSPPGILLWQGVEYDALAKGVTGYAPAQDFMNLHTIDLKT
jgi:peptide/nickel transport system substrate-binding protein